MTASIQDPQQRTDVLRAVLWPCVISPRPIPYPEIAPNSPIGGAR
jgi:hypothetical protein